MVLAELAGAAAKRLTAVRPAVQLCCADQSAHLASSLAMLSIFGVWESIGPPLSGLVLRGAPGSGRPSRV